MAGSEDRLSTMKILVTLKSASVVNDVDVPSNSKVYAVAWIEDGSRPAKQKTEAIESFTNPTWNDADDADPKWNKEMSFIVEEEEAKEGCSNSRLNDADPRWNKEMSVVVKEEAKECYSNPSWNDADPRWNKEMSVIVKEEEAKEGYSNPSWNDADPRWNKEMSVIVKEEAKEGYSNPRWNKEMSFIVEEEEAKEGYSNPRYNDAYPRWNKEMSFIVEEEALQQDLLRLKLELRTKKTETTGGKKVGDVSIPIKYLGEQKWPGRVDFWSYRVRNPSGKFTGNIDLTLQVIKPKSKLNDIKSAVNRSAPTEGKERKEAFTPPLTNLPKRKESKKKQKERKKKKQKERKKKQQNQEEVPLNSCTELAPGGQYPPQQAFTPLTNLSKGMERKKRKREERKEEGKKKKLEKRREERKKKKQKQEEVPLNTCTESALPYPHYPLQWQYPSSQHYPPSSGYPYPPFTLFTPPDYPQQAAYPNPNPTFPHAAAPPPPQHAQYLAPGGQYPLQQAYPQQGGYPYDRGGNIPYTVFPPAQQLAQQHRT